MNEWESGVTWEEDEVFPLFANPNKIWRRKLRLGMGMETMIIGNVAAIQDNLSNETRSVFIIWCWSFDKKDKFIVICEDMIRGVVLGRVNEEVKNLISFSSERDVWCDGCGSSLIILPLVHSIALNMYHLINLMIGRLRKVRTCIWG